MFHSIIISLLLFTQISTADLSPEDTSTSNTSTIEKTSDLRGYAFLIGGMVVSAAASAGIMHLVSPQAGFVQMMVGFILGQATFVGANLLSPFSEPVSSNIRRFAFALKERRDSNDDHTGTLQLEEKADAIQASYTLREQYAIDRIFVFRNALRLNFDSAARAIREGDREAIVAELADALVAGYLYFKDIDPREPAIINAIHASFLNRIEEPESLKDSILKSIEAGHGPFTSRARNYYERALDAWLFRS